MPGLSVQVALSEALEVRGGPLSEHEIWALLRQAVDALQDLSLKGLSVQDQGPAFAVTPDTIMVGEEGLVSFAESSFDSLRNKDFVPPEWNPRHYFTDAEVEKIFVFALGVSIYTSADFRLPSDQALDISDELDQLLGEMCEDDPTTRMTFIAVLNACSDHFQRDVNKVPSRNLISRLYRLVLGSDSQLSGFLDNGHQEYVTRSNHSRRSLSQERPQSAGPRSRSHSRSQPRSRSHSADRYSMFSTSHPRPVPLGHDQPPMSDHYLNHRKYPSVTSLHSNKHPHRGAMPFVPPYFGSQPNLVMHDPYLANAAPQYGGGRKIVGQSMRGDVQGYQAPYQTYGYGDGGLIQDPYVRQMYERLKERQWKLQALRRGLDVEGLESPDAMSTGSEDTGELADRRSVVSAHSYTQGAYQPDLYQKYGLSRALHLGREKQEVDTDDSANNEAWIRRQDEETMAMLRAIENFTGPRVEDSRQSRSRTKTPVGSKAGSRPNSRPSSRTGSRPESRARSEARSRSRPQSRSKSRGERKVPNKTPRKFYGPEFIQSDRVIQITVPTIKSTNRSHLRHVFVHLLNGEKLDVTCEHNTPGKDLYDAVVAHLGLPEHYLFGITYAQEGEYFFIEGDQRLSKVAPSHWKDPGKGKVGLPFTTYFRVKFYVENAAVLQHQVTRHLFYLQLRKDMLEDKICCSEEQALNMAGYAMQAEYGDWYDKAVGFIPEIYLPPRIMKRIGKAYAKETIPKQHRKYCGLPDDKAEVQYIKEVQQLTEYGIHFYKVYHSKKDIGNPVWTGISVQGILMAEQQGSSRVTTQRHPWQFTQKVSFSRRRFSITPKSDVGGMKLQKLNYYTDSYKKGRYLLHLSTAHHRFQIMMRQRIEPNLAAMIEEEYPAEAGDYEYEESEYLDDDLDNDYEDEDQQYSQEEESDQYYSNHDYNNRSRGAQRRSSRERAGSRSHDNHQLARTPDLTTGEESEDTLQDNSRTEDRLGYDSLPSKERPHSRASYSRHQASPHPRTPGSSRPASRPTTPGAHVIDVSFRSYDSSMELNQYLVDQDLDDLADPLFQSIDKAPITMTTAAPVERRVAIVELAKVPKYGIGLTIVGGENTGRLDLGIFVKSITPGGPADLSNNIQAGDRIIAINGHSLEGMPHHKAVELIRDAPEVVQLLISQPVEPYHANRTLDIDSDASLMDDLNSPKRPPGEFMSGYTSHNTSRDMIERQVTEERSSSLSLSQLNAVLQRTASVNSSDLELEDVVPPEALQPHYVETHKSPASPYINADMYHQSGAGVPLSSSQIDGRLSAGGGVYRGEGGRTSVDYSIEGTRKTPDHSVNRRPASSGSYPDGIEESDDGITSTNRTDTGVLERSYDLEMSSPAESPSAQSSARTVESVEHLQPGDVYEMVLRKQNNSLGLNVAGGVNTTVKNGGIYVKSLAPQGAADLDKRIHVGDKVIEVNGVPLSGSTHKQAVEALRSAPLVCHLLMERGVPPSLKPTSPRPTPTPTAATSVAGGLSSVDTPSSVASESMRTEESVRSPSQLVTPTPTSQTDGDDLYSFVTPENTLVLTVDKTDNTYAVELSKSSTGLGFSVLGGSDVNPDPLYCLVRVKKIFPSGPAHSSGLQEGDVILQVDNVKLRGRGHKEVMTVLRSSPPTVRLIVCRPEPGMLPSMEELRHNLLDNTMDSEINVPVAMSTPTADLILNERKPSFTNEGDEPLQEVKAPTPIHASHAYQYSDSESLATPRATPDHMAKNRTLPHSEEESESETDEEEETETDCQTGRTETETQSMATESHATTSTQNRTPSPVKTFLQDAGLGSYETTPAATPSVEQQMNSARSGMSSSTGLDGLEEEEETGDEEEMPSHVFEVTLTKEEKGLGFTVAGGSQTTGFFYVKDILYDPAKADGRIQQGDRLIMVNGQDMTDMQHKEAVVFLRQTPQTVTLVFERQIENDSDVTPTPSPRITHMSAEDKSMEPASVKNLISSLEMSGKPVIQAYQYRRSAQLSPSDLEDEEEVTKKGVQGRQATPRAPEEPFEDEMEDVGSNQRQMPQVTVTVEESLGEEEDREIHTPNPDDAHLLNTSRDDVMSTASSFGNVTLPLADLDESVKQEPEVKQITTVKERAPTPEGASNNLVVRVQLKKPSTGNLGFTLVQGEKGLSSALYVRSIAPGGVADRDGRLHINDKLLQVNGESVIGMPHNKAVALVKKATGTVGLAISRSESRPPSVRNTPAATPSGEVERNGEDNIDTIEMEEQEGILRGLIKAVTPGDDKQCDTDSDVDSATLDETNDDWGSSPRSGKTATTFGDLDTDDSDREDIDQFNEGTNAYRTFMESKGGVKREEAPAYRGKLIEKENREKSLTRFNRVPPRLSDEWLATLDVISPPDNNVHYSGRELRNTLKALKVKVERDDPVEEYKGLRHHKLTDNCIAARKPENKAKNRYRNVLPYDATRVCLNGTDDYINASHVKYQITKNQLLHYIATQGPMPETTGDFWRMIWELKVEVIAMVTQDMEGGKVKCHRYWPDSMTTPMTILDRYSVSLKSVQCLEHLDVHQICVTDTETGDTHLVTHINFTTWPDHGTPDSGLPIMQYMKLMHLLHDSGPIVVHCSAGIGRTGALITLDIVRCLIDSDNKFDIKKIVQEMRRQRQGMIQTKDQYRFCYKSVMETLTTLNAGFMSIKSMGDTL